MGDSEVVPDSVADGREPLRTVTVDDWSATPPSTAVPDAIARVEGTDASALPEEEDLVLAEYVDPDALDRLVCDDRAEEIVFAFSVREYTVVIDGQDLTILDGASATWKG